jgi:hypothetical protein
MEGLMRIVLTTLLVVFSGLPALAADPLTLYGPVATYDILRDGEPVGTHRIDFVRQGDAVMVESESDINVDFLFLNAYSFSYRATSVWQDGRLLRLEAVTDDDGEKSMIAAAPDENGLRLEGPAGTVVIDPTLPVSEHWSRAFIDGGQQLNTITGAVNAIEVEPLGEAFIPLASGTIRADRFQIRGDIQIETWYDDAGRWLGMRFAAQDSSTIEYRCRMCRADIANLP